jgi:uncharacterized protein (TIGR02246 family)
VGACEFSAVPAEGTAPDRQDAEADLRAAAAAFSAAFEAGDTTALGELYTADALLLAPGDTVRGRAAIRRWFAPREGGNRFDHSLTADAIDIHGNLAIDRGWWTQAIDRDDGTTSVASGVYLVIWRREADGRWRMAYDMWHAPYDRT